VGGSESFRASVQPMVRDAAIRGLSINELTASLRASYGHAYRRVDMLADLRRHRGSLGVSDAIDVVSDAIDVAAELSKAVPRVLGLGPTIARAGVAAFAIALLVPTILFGATRTTQQVLVADTSEVRAAAIARDEFSLPNVVAGLPRRFATPEPTPVPTPVPTPQPTPAPTPTPLRLAPGGAGVLVIASWYGPGFFENRLPCWRWLEANGLPIQFLPDTWGVAHKTLPCGTMLVLTHGPNTITVPVVDRGPYIAGRELDLSPRIKAALGCTDLCTVLMQLK
jgi:hypothetical protein